MCGIAGAVHAGPGPSNTVTARQLALLVRRGPDSQGTFASGRGAVGQTRLRIIDLTHGDPPITNETGTIGAVLNGEIYNFSELRRDLVAGGHSFRSEGDTEVLAHLAEDLDAAELARRLHGMYAFAVWDARHERLLLGRDPMGKKPLYYWHGPKSFVFGSEIKAVLAHPDVPADPDPAAMPAYLRFGYVPSPRTFFRGIRSVPPGSVMEVGRDLSIRTTQYWQVPCPGLDGHTDVDVPLDAAAQLVRDALRTAVRRRLISDVPLGAFLSGGIDSSAVVALMAEAARGPVRTFTIGFEDDDGFDERAFARVVASRFRTDHTEFVVQPQAVDLIDALVDAHDQPFGDSSAIPTYLLSELTRQHVTVALAGDGGDELFAGYERFAAGRIAEAWGRLPGPLAGAATGALTALPAPAAMRARLRRFASTARLGLPDAFRLWISYVPDDLAESLLPGGDPWGVQDYHRIWSETAGRPTVDRLLDLNLRTYLLDDLLPKVDRISMAHALEVRSPFLDRELVELACRLPARHKLRGASLKRVLKVAMADVLPPEILHRRKHGFGVPLRRWFKEDLASYVDAMLRAPKARVRDHLVGEVIDQVLVEHRRGAVDHGHAIWTLLTLEVFLRRQGW